MRPIHILIVMIILAPTGLAQVHPDDEETFLPVTLEGYEDPALDGAIGLLRSDTMKRQHIGYQDLIAGLQRFLHWIPKGKNAAGIRDEALMRLRDADSSAWEKAAIVLARFATLPKKDLSLLNASSDLRLACFGLWHDVEGPEETTVESDSRYFSRGARGGLDPVKVCTQELRDRFIIPEAELAELKEEYVEAYKGVLLPNLQRIETYLRPENRFWLDLDGDGLDELLIYAVIEDGWQDQPFSAILGRADERSPWKLRHLRKWEISDRCWHDEHPFLICDLDGDDRPEVVERWTIAGGWVWDAAIVYDESNLEAPQKHQARGITIVRSPITKRPILVERSCFNPTGGGKSGYLITALGTQLDIFAFDRGFKIEQVQVITRGDGWR